MVPIHSISSAKVQTENLSEAFKTSKTSTLSRTRCLVSLLNQRSCSLRKGNKRYLQGSTNCTIIKLALKRPNSLIQTVMVGLWRQRYPWECRQEIFQCRIVKDRKARPTCLKCMLNRWLAIATSWTTMTVTRLPNFTIKSEEVSHKDSIELPSLSQQDAQTPRPSQ